MRFGFRIGFALALSLALMAGCSDENGEGGSGGTAGVGGEGGTGGIVGQVFPCTEQGIRDTIALGGGPHTFACDGPQTLMPNAGFYIDKDVILDGESNLTVQSSALSAFEIRDGVNAELRGFSITGGVQGISTSGMVTVANSTVSGNAIGISSSPSSSSLTMMNSTVSGNDVGMIVSGELRVINSTVSGNNGEFCGGSGTGLGGVCFGGGIVMGGGEATIVNSTVSDNGGDTYASIDAGLEVGVANMTLTNTLVDGDCLVGDESSVTSGGHNIESPGDTCGFDTNKGDQVNVTAEQLNLGELADNGGPTMTHALLTEPTVSVAIDQIPAEDCVDLDGQPLTTDQRGEPRPETGGTMCDVGAFELQP
jgi:hypothetical protein